MNELVSIIVPVYNVQNYLEKCIESIIQQTYKNIEILLIDDGSTDNSLEICKKFQSKDQRIKTYHKKNGGLSDARNYGIGKSKGKYLLFVDSDDWIDENYVEYLYSLIKKYNSEISICEIVKITEEGKIVSNNLNSDLIIEMNQEEAIKNIITVKYFATSACGKMYKRECFNGILFPVGRLFEDIPTNYDIFLNIDKVVFGAKGLYYYLTRCGSITRKEFSSKNMDSVIFIEEAMEKVLNRYPKYNEEAELRIFLAYFDLLKCFNSKDKGNKYYIDVINKIKQIRKKVFLLKITDKKTKIKILLTYFPLNFIKLVFNMINR